MVERTEEQKKALRDAYKVLAENFDDLLIVASIRADQEHQAVDMDVYWKSSSWLGANILADCAKRRLDYQRRSINEPL